MEITELDPSVLAEFSVTTRPLAISARLCALEVQAQRHAYLAASSALGSLQKELRIATEFHEVQAQRFVTQCRAQHPLTEGHVVGLAQGCLDRIVEQSAAVALVRSKYAYIAESKSRLDEKIKAFNAAKKVLESTLAHEKGVAVDDIQLPWTLVGAANPPSVRAAVPTPIVNRFMRAPLGNLRQEEEILVEECTCCQAYIQFGTLFGSGTPRVHCLDCIYGDNVVCSSCFAIAESAVLMIEAFLAANPRHDEDCDDEAPRRLRYIMSKLDEKTVHLRHHVSGVEADCCAHLHRDVTVSGSSYMSQRISKCFKTYASRPCVGLLLVQGERTGERDAGLSTYRVCDALKRKVCGIAPRVRGGVDPKFDVAIAQSFQSTSPKHERTVVEWATFGNVAACCYKIARAILAVASSSSLPLGGCVGISVEDSTLWYISEISIVFTRRCAVGVYPLWSTDDILAAFRLAKVTVAILDRVTYERLAATGALSGSDPFAEFSSIMIISFAHSVTRQHEATNVDPRIHHIVLDLFQRTSPSSSPDEALEDIPVGEFHCDEVPAIVIFTSGTSGGRPKGVMSRACELYQDCMVSYHGYAHVGVSMFAPSWATDKLLFWRTFLAGGRTGFHPKNQVFFDTLRLISPRPYVSLVPFMGAEMQNAGNAVESAALATTLVPTLGKLLSPGAAPALAAAAQAYFVYRYCLGGATLVLSVGGAAVRQELTQFLRSVLPCVVLETLGLTECGGVLRNSRPYPGTQVTLIDRPDLGYTNADLPYPRGELAVRSSETTSLSSWICDDDTRSDIMKRYLSDSGYFLTGDIAAKLPDGTYSVIDRASAVRKLANGKFFSAERVEQLVLTYLHHMADAGLAESGDARTEFELELARDVQAVFVCVDDVDNSSIQLIALLNQSSGRSCVDDQVTLQKMRTLRRLARQACAEASIPQDEYPCAVALEIPGGTWSSENGMLTQSRKINRPALKKRAKELFEQQQLAFGDRLLDDVSAIAGNDPSVEESGRRMMSSPADLALAIVAVVFPDSLCHPSNVVTSSTFSQLGCDSLAASRVPKVLERHFNRWRKLAANGILDELGSASWRPMKFFMSMPEILQSTPAQVAERLWPQIDGKCENTGSAQSAAPVAAIADQNDTVQMVSNEGEAVTSRVEDAEGEDDGNGHRHGAGEGAVQMLQRLQFEVDEATVNISADLKKLSSSTLPLAHGSSAQQHRVAAAAFLTGAAGYLGSALLYELLGRNSVDAIVCLVRRKTGTSSSTPADRLLNSVRSLVDADPHASTSSATSKRIVELFRSKVIVVEGDIEIERFGLSVDEYRHTFLQPHILPLTPVVVAGGRDGESESGDNAAGKGQLLLEYRGFDLVIHNAASIKSWPLKGGLDLLKQANIYGSLRVGRLAGEVAAAFKQQHEEEKNRKDAKRAIIKFVFVSTVSVARDALITDQDDESGSSRLTDFPPAVMKTFDAYPATKLIAEHALANIVHDFAEYIVVRPPLLTWHSQSGAANDDDWVNRLIHSCVRIGMYPTAEALAEKMHAIPVDVCAQRVVDRCLKCPMRGILCSSPVMYPFENEKDFISLDNIFATLRAAYDEVRQEVPSSKALFPLFAVPSYAWTHGMRSIAATHPTRYHPLMNDDRDILKEQRSSKSVALTALPAMRQSRDDDALVTDPLKQHLRRVLLQLLAA